MFGVSVSYTFYNIICYTYLDIYIYLHTPHEHQFDTSSLECDGVDSSVFSVWLLSAATRRCNSSLEHVGSNEPEL